MRGTATVYAYRRDRLCVELRLFMRIGATVYALQRHGYPQVYQQKIQS